MSSIREIAKIAGVSIASVSRVINNDKQYKMTQETKNKIWKAVAETGYHPPSSHQINKQVYMEGKCKIGCILSVTKDKYKDPYFMSILAGIEERLSEKGYSLAFLHTFYELQDKNTLYSTFSEPITGLIIMENLNPDLYSYIRSRVPICVGVDTKHSDIDNIGYDHFQAAESAVEYLIEKGHKKIAFIGGSGPTGDIMSSQRYWGYYITMSKAHLEVNESFIFNCQWDEAICVQQVKEMMSGSGRPTAIFVASDLMAIAVLSALYSMHISVPQDVAVIGLSNIELSLYTSPPLTTLEIPTRQIGIAAVDTIEKRINGSLLLPQKIFFPTVIIPRESV